MTEKHTIMVVCHRCGKDIRPATRADMARRVIYLCDECKSKDPFWRTNQSQRMKHLGKAVTDFLRENS